VSHFLSDDQIALRADEYVRRRETPRTRLERLAMMIRYVEKEHYHIVSRGIEQACRNIAFQEAQ
jgi:hypothetical protein